ncbi:MAG TPA: phosphatidate cytidylyltransferase [Acidimicrobiales bacterium]|nr:phosphatidate cytidylyltransferase [Acidimicrobiales bacterium]
MADDSGFKPPDEGDEEAEGIRVVGPSEPPLRFPTGSSDDTTSMPHWTEPATGEMPRLLFDEEPAAPDEELEAWSSFAATPRWRSSADDWDDETDIAEFGDSETRVGALDQGSEPASGVFVFDDTNEPPTDPAPAVTPIRTGGRSAPAATPAAAAGATRATTARKQPAPPGRPGAPGGGTGGPAADRDLPVAVGVGVALAVVALVLFSIGPGAAMGLVTLVIAAAAAEFYAAMQKVAYRPATLLGIVACAGLPLAAYWRGEGAIPLVLALSVVFGLLWFLFAAEDVRPVPNLAVTLLGVVYVGLLGSFAALILKFPNGVGMLLGAIIATVAYDIGGLFVGSSAGRSHLAPTVSPNKTYEGLAGGMLMAILAAVVICGRFVPWDHLGDSIKLGIVVAIAAPLGDLSESMIKRDLGIKDMGTILPGHGGILDRFDALLFSLPAVYYLARVANIF